MVNRLIAPFFSFVDDTGLPRENYRLFFYAHGTSTKLDVYTDATGTLSANPLTLNSLGQAPNDVFGQDLAYKIVLASLGSNDPPTGSEVATYTNVSTSDFTARAKFTSYNGNPNTHVAGTAGTGSTPADAVWDYTNSVLYFCTTTGVAAAAVWTAYNPNTATSIVPPPQGRLTLVSGTPYMTSDQAGVATVYYTPDVGVLCPIYNGTAFSPTVFTERSLSLVASHTANSIYDVFAFSDSGVFTVGTGPAWTTGTAGSGARGTGAGTTELTRLLGLWVNAVQITARNGSTTYTVAANRGTYLGTIIIDGSNGSITAAFTFGQTRFYGVWNAYNRRNLEISAGDSTASWFYTTTKTTQPFNNNSANRASIVLGLQDDSVDVTLNSQVQLQGTSAAVQITTGIGFNSTSARTGLDAIVSGNITNETRKLMAAAALSHNPAIGLHTYTALENVPTCSGTSPQATFIGTSAGMQFLVRFRG